MAIEYKSVQAEVKELNEKGEGVLRFIRFDQEDKDSDITLPGFIGRQKAHLLPSHNWRSDHPPLGSGESFEADGATNFKFRLNLNTTLGKEWRDHLLFDKQHGALQQVSYGFSPYADGVEKWQKEGRTGRYLKPRKDGSPGARLHEVSFVIVGSGNDTAVMSIKSTDELLKGNEQSVSSIKESHSMPQEDPIVEPQPSEGKDADGSQDVVIPEAVDDWHAYAEDRRPPLPTMIKWVRLYRYHLPFLRDVRKRDKKEISPETISEFKTLVEECIEVATQLNIAGLKAELLPSAEEQELLRQKYEARSQELYSQMNVEQERAHQQQQAKAAELERKARERQALIKKWNSDEQ